MQKLAKGQQVPLGLLPTREEKVQVRNTHGTSSQPRGLWRESWSGVGEKGQSEKGRHVQWTKRKYRPWPRPMRRRGRWREGPTGRGKMHEAHSSQEEGSRPPGPGPRDHQPFLFQAHIRKRMQDSQGGLLSLAHLRATTFPIFLRSSPGKFKKNENEKITSILQLGSGH